jgi:hypothetical protein
MSESRIRAVLDEVCRELDRRGRRLLLPAAIATMLGVPGCAYGDFGYRRDTRPDVRHDAPRTDGRGDARRDAPLAQPAYLAPQPDR